MNRGNEELLDFKFEEMDFGNGRKEDAKILTVRWKGGIYLKLSYSWLYRLTITRENETLRHMVFQKANREDICLWVTRWAKEINDGKYNNKKTAREEIQSILEKRNLTSYMNHTKWNEFRIAMLKEMPFEPPYDYKTLFDEPDYLCCSYAKHLMEKEGPHDFCSFDEESFHFLDDRSLEWVKVRPCFYQLEGGRLVQKKIWYDAKEAFIKVLNKYHIPFEEQEGVYTIYGYK